MGSRRRQSAAAGSLMHFVSDFFVGISPMKNSFSSSTSVILMRKSLSGASFCSLAASLVIMPHTLLYCT